MSLEYVCLLERTDKKAACQQCDIATFSVDVSEEGAKADPRLGDPSARLSWPVLVLREFLPIGSE